MQFFDIILLVKFPLIMRDQQFHDYRRNNIIIDCRSIRSIKRTDYRKPAYRTIVAKREPIEKFFSSEHRIRERNRSRFSRIGNARRFLPRLFQDRTDRPEIWGCGAFQREYRGQTDNPKRKRNRSLIELSLRMVFIRKSPKLLFAPVKLRYRWISNPTVSSE